MKLIGFIKEHNNIVEARSYDSIKGDNSVTPDIMKKIIRYLNNGELILSWMGYFIDIDDGNLITPDSYFTDGNYVWPAYFTYYLKKHPKYSIDEFFLEHLHNCDFLHNESRINKKSKQRLELELSKKLDESWKK